MRVVVILNESGEIEGVTIDGTTADNVTIRNYDVIDADESDILTDMHGNKYTERGLVI